MTDGSPITVLVGLTIGIALVILFSLMLKPIDAMTDDELRKLVLDQYPQFQALKERYPDTTQELIERIEHITQFSYVATKEKVENDSLWPGPKAIAITLTIKPLSPNKLYASCGSGLSTDLPPTIQSIKTTDCLEVDRSTPAGADACKVFNLPDNCTEEEYIAQKRLLAARSNHHSTIVWLCSRMNCIK